MSKYCQSIEPCKATCLDFGFSIPSSLKQPITIHRSTEREILPFRHGMVISTYMNDYIPPFLSPGYMGHIPTMSNDICGKTFGNATKKYFHDCRQEILTKSTRPKFVFGRLPIETCSLPDIVTAERAIQWKKLADTPNIRPISFDKARFCEIQLFYQNAQAHRDYYLDKTEKVYPVDYFNLGRPYPTRCPVDERVFKIREPFGTCDEPGYLGPMPYYNCRTLPCIQAQGFLTPFTNNVKLPRPPFVCDRVKPKKRNEYETLLV